MEKKIIVNKAEARFLGVQFRGSRGDLLGIGRLSIRPSEEIRKTLPERLDEACLDLDEAVAEEETRAAMFSLVTLQATWAEGKTKTMRYKIANGFREMNNTYIEPTALSEVIANARGQTSLVS